MCSFDLFRDDTATFVLISIEAGRGAVFRQMCRECVLISSNLFDEHEEQFSPLTANISHSNVSTTKLFFFRAAMTAD